MGSVKFPDQSFRSVSFYRIPNLLLNKEGNRLVTFFLDIIHIHIFTLTECSVFKDMLDYLLIPNDNPSGQFVIYVG